MEKDYFDEAKGSLDTEQMLEDAILSQFHKSNTRIPLPSSNQRTGKCETNDVKIASISKEQSFDVEKLLLNLYEARDGLLELFSNINHNSPTGRVLTSQINKVGDCISQIGGQVEPFNPLDHISGLETPNQVINAQKVISQTKQYYKLGAIKDTSVSPDGKIIKITFEGKDGNINYKADGEITAKGLWTGNEAIDYVYAPESGKMSVKALNENGCWSDKYNDYDVYWELTENDESISEPTQNDSNEKDIKKAQKTKDQPIKVENNVDNENIDINFPIIDK